MEEPDKALSRRELLERTAYAAGVGDDLRRRDPQRRRTTTTPTAEQHLEPRAGEQRPVRLRVDPPLHPRRVQLVIQLDRGGGRDLPDLPNPDWIVSKPCEFGGGDLLEEQSAAAHESDLEALADIAEAVGIPVGESKPSDLFREPDKVRKALLSSG